jgi:two-component system chemotaxis response regulator CheY
MTTNITDQILVVDDSNAVRSIVRKILTQLGYIEVDEASDGAAALAKMNAKPYALVISDWNMEPMSGKALLVQARSTKKMEKIPFIIMTTGSDQYKVIKARFDTICFIDKPFSAEALQSKISELNIK